MTKVHAARDFFDSFEGSKVRPADLLVSPEMVAVVSTMDHLRLRLVAKPPQARSAASACGPYIPNKRRVTARKRRSPISTRNRGSQIAPAPNGTRHPPPRRSSALTILRAAASGLRPLSA